jgi:hypothetical protein
MFGLNYIGTVRQDITADAPADERRAVAPESRQVAQDRATDETAAREPLVKPQVLVSKVATSKRPVRIHSKAEVRARQDVAVRSIPLPPTAKPPVLSNYDDNDDRSLRLSDLFDNEVGIRK